MDKAAPKKTVTFWTVSDAILNISTAFLLLVIFVMMILQIIMRYIFDNPLTWSEEIARLSLFWMAFLGATMAVRDKAHLSVDLLTHKIPPKPAKVLAVVVNILILVFLGVLFYSGLNYVKMNLAIKSLVTGVSKGRVYTVIPLSALWMAVYQVRNLVYTLKGGGD